MAKYIKKKSHKVGLPPGTLKTVSDKTRKVKLEVINYNQDFLHEKTVNNPYDCRPDNFVNSIAWINIDGIHDVKLIQEIGEYYNLHPLLMEDISSPGQRPKLDDYDDYIFTVLNMLQYDEKKREVKAEQISFVLGENYVLSFQEDPTDIFNPNRERIRGGKGKTRKSGPDYLMYSLIDTIVDNYYIILEKIGDQIEELENKIITNPGPNWLKDIYSLKRELIGLRKTVWPLRELISKLERDEHKFIKPETQVFYKDVYDHTIQVIDTIESFRDILSGLLDVYLSQTSNKMNSIMKILTVISTIFIPLTFITGIYGMNFHNMPELRWENGYYMVLALCGFIFVAMIVFFKTKKWL
ncbi:MAG TPA: magnesium/cobalt transporter CorA [Cytophagaceae bacterium]